MALLSQTCDIVQSTKTRCTVAPVLVATAVDVGDAQKGRKPLLLLLESDDGQSPTFVVDMEHATSLPKAALVGRRVLARYSADASSRTAGNIAARIGRVFSRFPFSGEVYPVFRELRSRVQIRFGESVWQGD